MSKASLVLLSYATVRLPVLIRGGLTEKQSCGPFRTMIKHDVGLLFRFA